MLKIFNPKNIFFWLCRKTGRPFRSPASKEMKDAVEFLGWDINPELIIGAGKFFMFFIGFLILIGIGIAIYLKMDAVLLLLAFPFSIIAFYAFTEWPKIYAQDKAVAALGAAPEIISQLAVSLKQSPSLEKSMAFVANNSEGEIAQDFKNAIWKMWAGKKASALRAFEEIGEKWGKWSNGFHRSVYLIVSSFHEKNPSRRNFTLDKSIAVMLDDIVSRMKDYVLSMHMPTLLLFTLGIIIPLMAISLFPVLAFFGIAVSVWTIIIFLSVSLAGSALYSEMILRKRPPTISVHDIKPDVPVGYFKIAGHYVSSLHVAVAVAALLSFPGLLFLFQKFGVGISGPLGFIGKKLTTLPVLWGIGGGLSIYFLGLSYYKKARREKLKKLEEQFLDSLYHIKNRLLDGRPVEDSLAFAEKMSKGAEISEFLSGLLGKIKRRSMPLEKAVEESEIESKMIKSVFGTLTSTLKIGTGAAAQSMDVISRYLDRIQKVDKQLNNMLIKNISMMKATAIFFAPLVCSIIVVLFQLISQSVLASQQKSTTLGIAGESIFIAAPQISPAALQLIVGLYTLLLNFVLMRYVSRVQFGRDETAMNMSLATSFASTMIIFTSSLIIARAVLLGAI